MLLAMTKPGEKHRVSGEKERCIKANVTFTPIYHSEMSLCTSLFLCLDHEPDYGSIINRTSEG